jgi:polysaccharide pyruvyl transferase WcaK-like protein
MSGLFKMLERWVFKEMGNTESSNLRLALLTPYTGGNLGDGAIQDAVIARIAERLPKAQICLIALNPDVVSKLHKVPVFPITAFEVESYCVEEQQKNETGSQAYSGSSDYLAKIRARFDMGYFGRQILRPVWRMVKSLVWSVRALVPEIWHLRMCYGFLRQTDMLLVSGGGQIDDYWGGPIGHPYALFKWAVLAKAAGVRLVFVSVGVCTLNSKLSAFFVRSALRLAEYRSYRDHGSKQMLAKLNFIHRDRVTPDLAFSYPFNDVKSDASSRRDNKALAVGISPIAYLSKGRWPKEDDMIFGRYVESLVWFTAELLRRGYRVVLFASDIPDKEVVNLLVDRLRQEGLGDRMSRVRTADLHCVRELLVELAGLDCIVASRFHGIILSHLSLKPVVAISYDRKVTRHMQDMEQEQYCVDIHNLRAEELIDTFSLLASRNDAVKAVIEKKVEVYQRELASQYDDLARSIRREVVAENLTDVLVDE